MSRAERQSLLDRTSWRPRRSSALRRRSKYRPALECVEDRTLLSSVSWIGGSGDWDTASHWSTGVVPGPGDDVTIDVSSGITVTHSLADTDSINNLTVSAADTLSISAGSLSITAASTIGGRLDLTGGTLTGTGTITVAGAMTWSNATISGDSTLNAKGGLTISGASTNELLDARTLNIGGTATWSGTNNITLSDQATVNIESGVTFTAKNNQSILNGTGTGSRVDNAGTFAKWATSGTTTIGLPFNNTGTTTVSSGTLLLAGGGTDSKTFSVGSGAILEFDSPIYTVSSAGSFSGAGTVAFSGGDTQTLGSYSVTGPTDVDGGIVEFASKVTLAMLNVTAGDLEGPGPMTVTGTATWNGNTTIYTALTIAVGATLRIDGQGVTETLDLRTLNVAGTVNWSGANNLTFSDGATLNVQSGGHFDIQNNESINNGGGYTPSINVDANGMLTRSVNSGTTSVGIPFNNAGTVDVSTGTLQLDNGGTNTKTYSVSAGATLDLNSSVYFETGTNVAGAGTVEVNGVDYFDANFSVANLSVTAAGMLTVRGALTVTSTMTWQDSNINGIGPLTIPSGAILNIDGSGGSETIDDTTLNIAGTANWSGTNNIDMADGATINVEKGGRFNAQNQQEIYSSASATPTINNAGTFTVAATTGTTLIGSNVPFDNTGTVTVTTGTLELAGGGNGSGSFSVPAVSTLNLDAGYFSVGSISGAGTLDFTGGNTTVTSTITGSTSVTVAAGAAVTFLGNASTGAFSNAGNVVIAAGTTLALSGSYSQSAGETDLDDATMTIPSGGSVTISGGNFDGSGTIRAPSNKFTFTNGGDLYVGGNGFIGTLTIDGSFTLDSGGTVLIGIGGTGAGQFDVLTIAGTASLAGTLDVYGVGGYTPGSGVNFGVITYGSFTGTFGTVTGSINGVGFSTTYNAKNLTLTTT
jgi:fibronectin-binding autotransporter adhesin